MYIKRFWDLQVDSLFNILFTPLTDDTQANLNLVLPENVSGDHAFRAHDGLLVEIELREDALLGHEDCWEFGEGWDLELFFEQGFEADGLLWRGGGFGGVTGLALVGFALLVRVKLVVSGVPLNAACGLGMTVRFGHVHELVKGDRLALRDPTIPQHPRTANVPLINLHHPLLIHVWRLVTNRYLGNTELKTYRTASSVDEVLA